MEVNADGSARFFGVVVPHLNEPAASGAGGSGGADGGQRERGLEGERVERRRGDLGNERYGTIEADADGLAIDVDHGDRPTVRALPSGGVG